MTGKARTITELITYSVTNPPEHSNCVVVVDRDPSNKTELIAGAFYKDGCWYGITTREGFTIHPDSYWFEIPR